MPFNRLIRAVSFAGALALLAACGTQSQNPTPTAPPLPTAAPTAAAEASPTPAAELAAFRPLPEAACAELRDTMAKTIDVQVTLTISSFQDFMTGDQGEGCLLSASGTGADFAGGFSAVAKDLERMMAQEGWNSLPTYIADGPTGTALGMSKRNGLALIEAGWAPAPDANCPPDQPIFECELTPEQQLYTIYLRLAQD